MTHIWVWIFLFSFGVFSLCSLGMNAWAWRLQFKARSEKIEVENLKNSLRESANANLQYRAERDACTEEKRELQTRFDELFDPLQTEAIVLSRDLARFIASLETYPSVPANLSWDDSYDNYRGKGYEWGLKLIALYERDWAPRVNRFVQEAMIEAGYTNKRLSHFKDTIHGVDDIETVRAQLWLFVIRKLNVDFTGEI